VFKRFWPKFQRILKAVEEVEVGAISHLGEGVIRTILEIMMNLKDDLGVYAFSIISRSE